MKLVSIVLLLFAVQSVTAQTVSVTVDLGAKKQTLHGFGAALRPLVYGGTDYLSASERSAALTAAIERVGISTGHLTMTVEQGANDDANPFQSNPDGFDFTITQNSINAIVTPGEPLGLSRWYPGSRIDQRSNHAWMTALRTLDYDNYLDEVAENVEQQLIWWRDVYGKVPTLIQLFNEPTTGNTELRGAASVQEVVDIIERAGARIRAAGFMDTYFIVPSQETVASSLSTAQLIFNNPDARQYVGAISYHPYPYGSAYSSPARILSESGSGSPNPEEVSSRQSLRLLADQFETTLGREVQTWMTEVSEGPGNSDFPPGSIQELRARAIHIHDEIRYAGASAYYGMHLLWDQKSHIDHFAGQCDIEGEESTIVLIDNYDCNGDGDTGEITINQIGYAIGHYARWTRPGSVVVESTSTDPFVLVTGIYDQKRGRLAVVLVNNRHDDVSVQVALSEGKVAGTVTGELSRADIRWGTLPAVEIASGVIALTLQPKSVVSLGIPVGTDTSNVPDKTRSAPSLGAPFPNPTVGPATAPFTLAEGGRIRLEVVDTLGRVVAVLKDSIHPAGAHFGHVPSGLTPGQYILRLRTPDGSIMAPLTIVQ